MSFDLNEVAVFRAVAKTGKFSLAAQKLGVPKSYVSRKVAELEARLGLRLLERTTRRVRLTEDGDRYFATCDRALGEIEDIERDFDESHTEPRGRLRITCPVEFGPQVTRFLAEKYVRSYPGVTVEVLASNTVFDLIRDQIDVAIRPMRLADPSMISLRIGQMNWAFYASKSYLASQKSRLRSPADLSRADVIAFNPAAAVRVKSQWSMRAQKGGRVLDVPYSPSIIVASLSALGEAVASGLGVAALPTYVVENQLVGRGVERILGDWINQEETLVAVYASSRFMPSRVRLFLDAVKKHGIW